MKRKNDKIRIVTKTIKSKDYWYLLDSLYINKRNIKKVSRSLGPAFELTTQDIELAKTKYLADSVLKESSVRQTYWKDKVINKKSFTNKTVTDMEDLRSQLQRRKIYALGPEGRSMMEIAFLTDFIYNSNKIEGSRLPRSEVKNMILKRRSNYTQGREVVHTIEALNELKGKRHFSTKTILDAQKALLKDQKNMRGLRTTEIVVGEDNSLAEPGEIKERLLELAKWYKENEYIMYPPELAFTFYYRFERIHPFADGNGRIGRLLMNQILKNLKYHPIIIWNKNRTAHFNAFKRAVNGNMRAFYDFMIEQYKKTYRAYIEKLPKATTADELVDYFLTPSESE